MVAGCSLLWAAPALAASMSTPPGTAAPTLPVPPALQALMHASTQLSLRTAIVREQSEVTDGVRRMTQGAALYHVRFDSHQELAVQGRGQGRLELRAIGRRAYFGFGVAPAPWVSLGLRQASHTVQWQGLSAGDMLDSSQLGAAYLGRIFAPLVAKHVAITVSDAGPATVDGRGTERFDFSFTLPLPQPPKRSQHGHAPPAPVGGLATTLQAYVAPNGLVVEQVLGIQYGLVMVTTRVDVVGVDVPMRIRRPVHARPAQVLRLGHGIDVIVPPGVRVPPALLRHAG